MEKEEKNYIKPSPPKDVKFVNDVVLNVSNTFSKVDSSENVKITENVKVKILPDSESATSSVINDSPSKIDLLGFKPYVSTLARIIIHPDTITPLSIGIIGPWGSGKTSFMSQVKEEISKLDEKIRHVEFNAWKYGIKEKLWGSFLQKLILQIENNIGWKIKIKIKVKALLKKTNKISLIWNFILTSACVIIAYLFISPKDFKSIFIILMLIPFGIFAFIINPLTNIWKKLKLPLGIDINEMVSNKPAPKNIETFSEFEIDFAKILDDYVGSGGRLVIYIDDVDRCSADKIMDIFETINVFLDTKRCVFLIGLDRKRVIQTIGARLKNSIEFDFKIKNNASLPSEDKGYKNEFQEVFDFANKFLDKIIQIPINIPYLDTNKKEIFVNYLLKKEGEPKNYFSELSKNIIITQDIDYGEDVEKALIKTTKYVENLPRSIKKFLNLFRFIYLHYIINRENYTNVEDYAIPIWTLISYKFSEELNRLESSYINSKWDSVENGFDGKIIGVKEIITDLKSSSSGAEIMPNINGDLKEYFLLTRCLYKEDL
jgi:hypothetical protein